MRKTIFIGFLVTVVCIGAISLIAIAKSNSHSHVISLKKAYSIGFEEAKKWNKDAKLIYLTSVDDTSTNEEFLGESGKRFTWNMIFGDIQKNKVLILNVKGGKVDHKQESSDSIKQFQLISQNEIVYDSTDLVQVAKKYNLKPGVNWAKGYHFTIEKDENSLFFAVVGVKDKKFTKLFFNPKTGAFIGQVTNK